MRIAPTGLLSIVCAFGLQACHVRPPVAQFDDIPVPDGLELIEDEQSHSVQWVDAKFRHGQFRYEGRRSATEVEAFLLDRMPTFGWRLLGQESADESGNPVSILRFRRPQDNATCYVEDVGDEYTNLKITVTTVTDAPSTQANR
ncbi:MAG: hypothetical protein AAF196_01700 [Planctomycetota bacterium]